MFLLQQSSTLLASFTPKPTPFGSSLVAFDRYHWKCACIHSIASLVFGFSLLPRPFALLLATAQLPSDCSPS